MLKPILAWFEIQVDIDLDVMQPNQTLASLSAACLLSLDQIFAKHAFDCVLVQGDTTTAFVSSLAAFYRKIAVAHVEAGLRTFNKWSPWPEEINRNLISKLADVHFVPTDSNRQNLLAEGVKDNTIVITGNTVIDALLYSSTKLDQSPRVPTGLEDFFTGALAANRMVLITGHRRENMGDGFVNICRAIKQLAVLNSETYFIYPVHLNPNVQLPVKELLSGQRNILLVEPLGYPEFITVMKRSYLILTDSGGVQEEAPSLGKPVLVMRDTTERMEGILAGTVKLVGNGTAAICSAVQQLLDDEEVYERMTTTSNPYGDGKASQYILQAMMTKLRT
jgi:UDP-N-acetylglucosamine 2-epimerase (non-hydrolysing)